MIKVEGHSHLRRDPTTNAVLNVDQDAFARYKKGSVTKQLTKRMDQIESDVSDIKHMLQALTGKLNGN